MVTQNYSPPLRVLVGHVPAPTAKDAKSFVLALAEKHLVSLGLVSYGVYPHGDGFAYEVHEAGSGRALLPQVLKQFSRDEADRLVVVFPGASRLTQVEITPQTVLGMLLPESAEESPTEWIQPGAALTPAVPSRRPVLYLGIAMFVAGFISMIAASFWRYQPIEQPEQPKQPDVNVAGLPISEWPALEAAVGGERVVRTLEWDVKSKAWKITYEDEVLPSVGPEGEGKPAEDAKTSEPSSDALPANSGTPKSPEVASPNSEAKPADNAPVTPVAQLPEKPPAPALPSLPALPEPPKGTAKK